MCKRNNKTWSIALQNKKINIKQENHHENGEPRQKVAKDFKKKQLIFRSNFEANKKIARSKLLSVRFMSAKWVFRFLKLAWRINRRNRRIKRFERSRKRRRSGRKILRNDNDISSWGCTKLDTCPMRIDNGSLSFRRRPFSTAWTVVEVSPKLPNKCWTSIKFLKRWNRDLKITIMQCMAKSIIRLETYRDGDRKSI